MRRTKRRTLCDIMDAFNRSENDENYITYKEALKQRDDEYRQELLIGFDLTGLFVHNTSIAIH